MGLPLGYLLKVRKIDRKLKACHNLLLDPESDIFKQQAAAAQQQVREDRDSKVQLCYCISHAICNGQPCTTPQAGRYRHTVMYVTCSNQHSVQHPHICTEQHCSIQDPLLDGFCLLALEIPCGSHKQHRLLRYKTHAAAGLVNAA